MITLADAVSRVKKEYPKRVVTFYGDYDDQHYLVGTAESNCEVNYNDPYIAVRKRDGALCSFSPLSDADKLSRCMRTGTVTEQATQKMERMMFGE